MKTHSEPRALRNYRREVARLHERHCYRMAFGIPAVLAILAIAVAWLL